MTKKTSVLCNCFICKSGRCGICNPNHPDYPPDHPILLHKLITSKDDILELDFINWRGLNGSWNNTKEALHTISSWFVNLAHATVWEVDLSKAPKRNDFPGWDHVGNHASVGKAFWNWFYWRYDGELILSDAPDFYGTLKFKNHPEYKPTIPYWTSNDLGHAHFWGDVEYVSAQALALTQKHMELGSLWISAFFDRQVLIQPIVDLQEIWNYEFDGGHFWEDVRKGIITPSWVTKKPEQHATLETKPIQLRLL